MRDTSVEDTSVMALPSLGADMDFGAVLEWYVAPGDEVQRGDVVALVSTEKADIDVEVWQAGVIAELLAPIGDEIPVGAPLLRFESPGTAPTEAGPVPDDAPAVPPVPAVPAIPTVPPVPAVPTVAAGPRTGSAPRVRSSPLARVIADQRRIDLAVLHGSGPGGAVLAADVQAHDRDRPSTGRRPSTDRASSMRAVIADRMAVANREIPHYFLDQDIDIEHTLEWLTAANERRPVAERILPAALFLWATARAAADVPALNGHWTDGAFQAGAGINVATAISLRGGGLVTPVISDADTRTLEEIMADLRAFVAGARSGSLRSSWMSGATITVTNLGDRGADRVGGVIFPPQVALVGFGSTRRRPWVDEDKIDGEQIVARRIVTATLAADHRATDGATGSSFLSALAHHLSHAPDVKESESS